MKLFWIKYLNLLLYFQSLNKSQFLFKNLILLNIIYSVYSTTYSSSEQLFHSNGYSEEEKHEIVFPRITRKAQRIRRDSGEGNTASDGTSDSKGRQGDTQNIITIRAENLNTTFYVVIYPNNEFIATKILFEETERNQKQNQNHLFDKNCLYIGEIIAPVRGRAAVTRCDNSDKLYALMITETEGAFVLRPLDSTYYPEIKYRVKTNGKQFDSNQYKRSSVKNYNRLETKFESQLFGPIDRKEVEDSPELMAHVLVRINQSQTEFCDLAFIDENDRKRAFNEFISPNDWKHKSFSNEILGVRKRRAVTTKKTIETAVFIDKHLLNRFNGLRSDLTRLVLAIMNEVQLIYSFRTMKTRIKIVIKKIVFLSQSDNSPDTSDGDIDEYLDNFCSWQSKKWRNENASNRWDHALMLTGLDLYKQMGETKNKKVLGLAWVNGMCKPTYSCTLNEGKSFEAAFVIAHEMGHSLGILHDGTGNNCDPEKYIMSEKTGPGKINWSPCSNIYLENFLTKANAKCLDDDSNPGSPELNFERTNRLPGEQYSVNKQCQLALGTQYKAYTSSKEPFNDVCRELWCLSGSWATPAHPALEGSTCADGKKCIQGLCQSSASYVSRRSIKNLSKTNNEVLPHQYQSTTKKNNRLAHNRALPTKSSKGVSRSFMDSVKGFLRSATSGAQDFFKMFTR